MVPDDIRMELGLDKCAKVILKRGKKILTEGTQLNGENVIQKLKPEATYSYLCTEEKEGTEYHKMKTMIKKEYKRSLMILI